MWLKCLHVMVLTEQDGQARPLVDGPLTEVAATFLGQAEYDCSDHYQGSSQILTQSHSLLIQNDGAHQHNYGAQSKNTGENALVHLGPEGVLEAEDHAELAAQVQQSAEQAEANASHFVIQIFLIIERRLLESGASGKRFLIDLQGVILLDESASGYAVLDVSHHHDACGNDKVAQRVEELGGETTLTNDAEYVA